MLPESLTTPRLLLRKLTPEVYRYLYSTMDDVQLMDFLCVDAEGLEKEKHKYAKGLSTYNRSFTNFLLIEKETGRAIGGCGFHTWFPEHSRAEIGYALYNDDHKQKGFMTEALTAVLDYGFNQMGLNRIEALVAPDNKASLALLARFGFAKEGLLRSHYCKNGIMEDSVAYALLARDYKK